MIEPVTETLRTRVHQVRMITGIKWAATLWSNGVRTGVANGLYCFESELTPAYIENVRAYAERYNRKYIGILLNPVIHLVYDKHTLENACAYIALTAETYAIMSEHSIVGAIAYVRERLNLARNMICASPCIHNRECWAIAVEEITCILSRLSLEKTGEEA